MLMGHSTGGLVGSLVGRPAPGSRRGAVSGSPWLDSAARASRGRSRRRGLVAGLARTQPKNPLPNIDPGHYARTVHVRLGGAWDYDERWRPSPFFPVVPAWSQVILAGHAHVARGLDLDIPVLMAASQRTVMQARWREDMTTADTVLDVDLIARRAVLLGSVVTVVRIDGGLHDLTLSAEPARGRFYAEVSRWCAAYGWG